MKYTAQQRYDELGLEEEIKDPLEQLRAFCSLAMDGQDWVDVEKYFKRVEDLHNKWYVESVCAAEAAGAWEDLAKRLAEALDPFADLLQDHNNKGADGNPVFGINNVTITLGQLRAARIVLNEFVGAGAKETSIKEQRDEAIRMLADWCVAINENGTSWDDWDDYYKDAMYRDGPLRELLDVAIAEARKQR